MRDIVEIAGLVVVERRSRADGGGAAMRFVVVPGSDVSLQYSFSTRVPLHFSTIPHPSLSLMLSHKSSSAFL